MKRKAKFLLCAVALCASTLFPLSAFALTSPAEVNQALQNAEAYMLSPDGERIELDITDVEVKQIPVPAEYRTRSSASDFVAYAATTKVKTDTTSYKKNGIDATAALTMTWVDGPGVDNRITNLTGYSVVAKGTFLRGKIFWGSTYEGPTFAPYSRAVGDSFDVAISYKSDDGLAGGR